MSDWECGHCGRPGPAHGTPGDPAYSCLWDPIDPSDSQQIEQVNTHYAVLVFPGDLDDNHPDEDLRGSGPRLDLIAVGSENFCWDALAKWTAAHPLMQDQTVEVLKR